MTEPDTRDETPTDIYASGPSDAAEPTTEQRSYETNEAAFADKQRQSLAAQTAPNPTTDIDLARQAYGEDWNRRRAPRAVAMTEDGDVLLARGGTVVDTAGHVLGSTADVEAAVARKESLGGDGELGRYPVTAEAQSVELRQASDDDAERYSAPADATLSTDADPKPAPPRKATGGKVTGK